MSRRELAAGGLLALGAAALSAFTIVRGYGPHDEGLMLAWARRIADGQWPYRDFWANYAPGQPLLLAALVKLFGPSLLWWRIVRVAVDATVVRARLRLRAQAGRDGLGRGRVGRGGRGMAWPSGPGPNPPALALALGALLAARRAPLGAGALAGLAIVVRPEVGIAAAFGAALEARRPAAARVALAAAAVAALALAPFAIVAGGAMADQVLGFASLQDLQRLPFPLHYDGPFDLNKLLEFYLPAILVAGSALWAGWALARRDGIALAPLVAVGLAYLLARTDEFHLVPLSVVLAVALACAAGREARALPRAALGVALALVAVHGLERRAGQALHPPALARHPGGGGRRRAHRAGRRRRAARADPLRAGAGAGRCAGARRPAPLRPGARRRSDAQRAARPAQPDALRRGAAGRGDDREGPARDGGRPARHAGRRALAVRAGARARAQRLGAVERRLRARSRHRARLSPGRALR